MLGPCSTACAVKTWKIDSSQLTQASTTTQTKLHSQVWEWCGASPVWWRSCPDAAAPGWCWPCGSPPPAGSDAAERPHDAGTVCPATAPPTARSRDAAPSPCPAPRWSFCPHHRKGSVWVTHLPSYTPISSYALHLADHSVCIIERGLCELHIYHHMFQFSPIPWT